MPEYHQIEIYIDLKSDLAEVKSICSAFFEKVGWLNPFVQEWLDDFAWNISDDGIGYGPQLESPVKHHQYDINLGLLIWTPKILSGLKTNCVELDIRFETEKIEDHSRIPQIRYTEKSPRCHLGGYARSWETFSGLWSLLYR